MSNYEMPVFNHSCNNHKLQSIRLQLDNVNIQHQFGCAEQSVITLKEITDNNDKLEWFSKFCREYKNCQVDPEDMDMNTPGCYYIVLEEGEVFQTVGFVNIINYVPSMDEDDNCLAIIYLDPGHRKKGIYNCILSCDLIRGVMVDYRIHNKYVSFFNKNGLFKKRSFMFDYLLVKQ